MRHTIFSACLVACSYVLAIFVAGMFGLIYDQFPATTLNGGFIGSQGTWEWIIGYPLGVTFLLTLFIHTLEVKNKWRWNIIAVVPIVLFEIAIDPLHIYILIILALVAWLLGTIANKILLKLAPAFMAKLQ